MIVSIKNMNCFEKIYNRLIELDYPIESINVDNSMKRNLLLEIVLDKNDLDNFINDVYNNLNLSIGPFPENTIIIEISQDKLIKFPQNTNKMKFLLNAESDSFIAKIIKNLPSKLKILLLKNTNSCDISNLPTDLVELELQSNDIYNLDNLPASLKKIKIYFNHYSRCYCLDDFINLPIDLEEITFYTESYVTKKKSITYYSYTELIDNYENFI